MGKTKRHGPRYKLKRTPKHYVTRRPDGTFKNFTRVGRSLASDRVWKAKKKTKKPGYGHRKDW